MTKLLKILGRIVVSTIELVILLLIILFFALKSHEFQTFLGQKASAYLSGVLENEITIEKIDIAFFDHVFLDDLYITDQSMDTLVSFQTLEVNFDLFSFEKDYFPIDYVSLEDPVFRMRKEFEEDETNLQFLVDFFKSDKEKSPSEFELYIAKLRLNNAQFSYEDRNKPMKDFGVDFAHLNLKRLNLIASDITINNDEYSAEIDLLDFRDKSGFVLDNFYADAVFSQNGLRLSDTYIETPYSQINIPNFLMKTEDFSSYKEFVDTVDLNIDLKKSEVRLSDVAFFAPALKGMNDLVEVSVNTRGKVKDWSLNNTEINIFSNTFIRGDFKLPDFREEKLEIDQVIDELSINFHELLKLKLPDNQPQLNLPQQLINLNTATANNVKLSGEINDVTINMAQLYTSRGNIVFGAPVNIKNLTNDEGLHLSAASKTRRFVSFSGLELGKILDNKELKRTTGFLNFDLKLDKNNNVNISKINGNLSRFDFQKYNYKNIFIPKLTVNVQTNRSVPVTTLFGSIYVRDPNLDLEYHGRTKIGEKYLVDFSLDLQCAHLADINKAFEGRGEINTKFEIQGEGTKLDDFSFVSNIEKIFYEEEGETFAYENTSIFLERVEKNDHLVIKSDILDAEVKGYADLDVIFDNILYQSARVFPAFFTDLDPVIDLESELDYTVNVKSINPILDIFFPEIQVADSTYLSGFYNGKDNMFDLNINSDYFKYGDFNVEGINLFQELEGGELIAFYTVDKVYRKDSLLIKDFRTTNIASGGFMDSQIIFDDKLGYRSDLQWFTHIFESDGFDIDILPSYFTVNNHRWDLNRMAHVNFSGDCFLIDDFLLERKNQYIDIHGQISKVPTDSLHVDIRNLDLSDVGAVLIPDNEVSGRANISGVINEPFSEFKFSGKSFVDDLIVDNREVGDINFFADYNSDLNKIEMNGDLVFKEVKTFDFSGFYDLNETDEPLNYETSFNGTDIKVLNAFMDPNVVKEIQGKLHGKFNLTGSFAEPNLKGKLNLKSGKFNLALLGADFFFDGDVISNNDGIFINAMPISDEDGNTGFLNGHLFHTYFTDLMYEITFNFETHPRERDPSNPNRPKPVNRFKVMNTKYTEESLYYGTAYMRGFASVSGYGSQMSVNVDAETRNGTWINFPMYGPTTIEEDGFIRFKSPDDNDSTDYDDRIDFTGVDLALNFKVTQDARVKLIFDESTGDEITAYGKGDLKISLDNFGEVALNGTYEVVDGVYNFVMGPYRQDFFIAEGGTVQWSGSPYSALLDIQTYYKTTANLAVVMNDPIRNRATESEEIHSILRLKGDMNRPNIDFDLDAPKASEYGKSIINRIRSDKEELNRQFFSILIWRRFQPLAGQEGRGGAGGGAAMDLVSTQINSLLSQVSDDYQMNFAMDSDEMTGESSVEFGVTKNFMDDRLIVSGSFGVGSYTENASNQNNFIGDFNLEYLLNDRGNFRINAFNESNAYSIMQTTGGLFTQGVGINYQEEFNGIYDFEALQFMLNIFRKTERKRYESSDRYEPIPEEYLEKKDSTLQE